MHYPLLGLLAALIVVLLILIAGDREGFASARATRIAERSHELFTRQSDAGYTAYRQHMRDEAPDPVQFADVRQLWRAGALTPEAVEKKL